MGHVGLTAPGILMEFNHRPHAGARCPPPCSGCPSPSRIRPSPFVSSPTGVATSASDSRSRSRRICSGGGFRWRAGRHPGTPIRERALFAYAEKFTLYIETFALREYLLVEKDEVLVATFRLTTGGSWEPQTCENLDASG